MINYYNGVFLSASMTQQTFSRKTKCKICNILNISTTAMFIKGRLYGYIERFDGHAHKLNHCTVCESLATIDHDYLGNLTKNNITILSSI